ncbi:MAG: DUF927 domain-containing protein [Oscillospiraceae bacterium]|nr:DUF927 domain-containing protein [Oscillospiraceae bacterium]
MSKISTNATIQSGYYGTHKQDKKTAVWHFKPLGKAIFLEEMQENIENETIDYLLSFEYFLDKKYVKIDGKDLGNPVLADKLNDAGANVGTHNQVLVDSIRLQIDDAYNNGPGAIRVYEHLGWIDMPVKNGSEIVGTTPCYRANTLIGGIGKYTGDLQVKPMGSFKSWAQMVRTDVVGNTPLELVLLAGLSAVVNGLISPYTTGESPIFHLYYTSSSGKSSAGYLATSTASEPFDGEKNVIGERGMIQKKHSLYSSWGSTENATITKCAGNYGAIIVLNELGKFAGNDMTRIIYNLSEGSDKIRLTQDMKVRLSEGYATTFISIGETSLLERCKDKSEGLFNRVMEINEKFTTDAAHADRIKAVCREHNGHAAPMMAEYILDNGGLHMCRAVYEEQCDLLRDRLPDSEFKERFISKFAALIMTTAEIATKALGIPFDIQGLFNYFVAYEKEHGAERNVSASSYEVVLEACSVNRHKFYRKELYAPYDRKNSVAENSPLAECWGRISEVDYELTDGRKVIEEIEIYPSAVEGILAKNGFPNKKTCFVAWKTAGLIDYEDSKNYRKRKVDPFSNELKSVVVFRIFDSSKKVFSKLAQTCEATPLVTGKEVSFDDNMAHTA